MEQSGYEWLDALLSSIDPKYALNAEDLLRAGQLLQACQDALEGKPVDLNATFSGLQIAGSISGVEALDEAIAKARFMKAPHQLSLFGSFKMARAHLYAFS